MRSTGLWTMTMAAGAGTTNLLLSAMPPVWRAKLLEGARRTPFERDQPLFEPHEPMTEVIFPESGVGSVTASLASGGMTEVGIIGCEGLIGLPGALGVSTMPMRAFVQIGGGTALRIQTSALRAAMLDTDVRRVIECYAHFYIVQTSCSVLSNAQHRIEARLARWLLMSHDPVAGDDVHLTHEFMALMVAAQCTGVTVALHVLEGAYLVRACRGIVTIRDRPGLEVLAEDTYGIPEAEYARLIAPFGKTGPEGPFRND